MESVNRQKQASTPRILSQFSDSVEIISIQNVEVADESGTKQIRDERKRIELAETGEEFR